MINSMVSQIAQRLEYNLIRELKLRQQIAATSVLQESLQFEERL